MTRRIVRRSPATPAPQAPKPPERERYKPAWLRERHGGISSPQSTTVTPQTLVEHVVAGVIRLPRFQRAYVWTDEQIARLFASMVGSYHVGQILVWERYRMPTSVERFGDVEVPCPAVDGGGLLVDGQQRVGAIVSAALSGRWWFDLETGALVTEGGPGRVPARWVLDRCNEEHYAWRPTASQEERDAFGALYSLMGSGQAALSVVRLGTDWPLARVAESYRRLAVEGTPHDATELEEALARALEEHTS